MKFVYIYIYIQKSISRRLSNNSSNIDIFNKHKHIYDKALKYSGYIQALEFIPPKTNLSTEIGISFGLTHLTTNV